MIWLIRATQPAACTCTIGDGVNNVGLIQAKYTSYIDGYRWIDIDRCVFYICWFGLRMNANISG